MDAALGVYLTGTTSSYDFPTMSGGYQTASTKTSDSHAFIAKLDLNSQVSCTLSVSPGSYAAPLAGSTSTFAIITPQGCPWVLYNQGGDVAINSVTHGYGNATVSFTLASNAGSANIVSTAISVGTAVFSITQPAGSCATPVISPVSSSFNSSGGLDQVSIAALPYCSHTAKGSAPWITVTAGSPFRGSVSVTYFVDRNDFANRSATLLLDRVPLPINQTGAGCTATASVVSGTGASGGTGSISLTTSANTCAWKAYSLAPWIQLATNGGSGSGNIGIALAPNPGTGSRTGQIQIAGQTLTVGQAPGPIGTPQAYTISTIAGNATQGFSGDGGLAASAQLSNPFGVVFDASGNLYIADTGNNRVRKVGLDGNISTFAGNGSSTESNVSGPATAAGVVQPHSLAIGPGGDLYIGESSSYSTSIRKVSGGVISTLTASGVTNSLAVDSANNVYAGGYGIIQKITPSGAITVIAGQGTGTSNGDGGPPASAIVYNVNGLAFDGASNLYLSESDERVRRIAGNTITTVAGTGACCLNGDGLATSSQFADPMGLATDPAGNVLVVDGWVGLLRRFTSGEIC